MKSSGKKSSSLWVRAEDGLVDSSRFGVFKGSAGRKRWAWHGTLCLSGVCIWFRATSAKLLPDLNENAEITGPSAAERNGDVG